MRTQRTLIVANLFIPVCRYKCYFHPRHCSLSDARRAARKVFREVRARNRGRTCSEFRAVLNSLLNPTTIRFPPCFSSTSCPVCFHAQVNPYAVVYVSKGERRGESFTSRTQKTRRRKKLDSWTGKPETAGYGRKTGRSSENSSTLLRVSRSHISPGKNNGYFLPRLSASVEMKTLRPQIPRNVNAVGSGFVSR